LCIPAFLANRPGYNDIPGTPAKDPWAPDSAVEVIAFVQRLRAADLIKSAEVAETLDWAPA